MKNSVNQAAASWCMWLFLVASVIGASSLNAGQFGLQTGVSYNQGVYDVWDKLDDNFDLTDEFVWPVGLCLNPFYEWDSGWAVGVAVGPAAVLAIDEGSDEEYSFILPVGGDVRYTFLRHSNTAPYVRGGIRYPIVGGDYLDSGEIGAFGAVGVEFWRQSKVQLVLEIAYDSSSVKVERGPLGGSRRATYAGFMAGVGVKFRF